MSNSREEEHQTTIQKRIPIRKSHLNFSKLHVRFPGMYRYLTNQDTPTRSVEPGNYTNSKKRKTKNILNHPKIS